MHGRVRIARAGGSAADALEQAGVELRATGRKLGDDAWNYPRCAETAISTGGVGVEDEEIADDDALCVGAGKLGDSRDAKATVREGGELDRNVEGLTDH